MPVHPQVQPLLDAVAQTGGPGLHEVPPAEGRLMFKVLASMEACEDVERVDDRLIPGPDGDIPTRVYTPQAAVGEAHGVLVWFHGGGWVIGDLDTADSTCRALANRAGCVVVSVDYRLAPEHAAPAALEDCMTALAWTVENFELLGVDASKVAVGGDSAGGNLAALVCQRVRDEFGPEIDFQLLVYPVTDLTLSHPSMDENAEGYVLTKASMEWFVGHYLGDADPKDASVSPLHADDLTGLPPALVITAEMDPLRDEGEAYAARLQEAGVPTELVRYAGQIHGFMGMATMLDDGKDAVERAGAALRAALA
ncbi:MAG: alpha/beta hydrolase [Acidimicrobiales bacterium]